MRALALAFPLFFFLAPASFAATPKQLPIKVKVIGHGEELPCKCEGPDDEVQASKVKTLQCMVKAEVDPRQPVDPFAKAYLLMNEVLSKKTLIQVPDSKKCEFKPGTTTHLWANDVDSRFNAATPTCGHEGPDYAKTCDPFGRYMTLFERNQLGVR